MTKLNSSNMKNNLFSSIFLVLAAAGLIFYLMEAGFDKILVLPILGVLGFLLTHLWYNPLAETTPIINETIIPSNNEELAKTLNENTQSLIETQKQNNESLILKINQVLEENRESNREVLKAGMTQIDQMNNTLLGLVQKSMDKQDGLLKDLSTKQAPAEVEAPVIDFSELESHMNKYGESIDSLVSVVKENQQKSLEALQKVSHKEPGKVVVNTEGLLDAQTFNSVMEKQQELLNNISLHTQSNASEGMHSPEPVKIDTSHLLDKNTFVELMNKHSDVIQSLAAKEAPAITVATENLLDKTTFVEVLDKQATLLQGLQNTVQEQSDQAVAVNESQEAETMTALSLNESNLLDKTTFVELMEKQNELFASLSSQTTPSFEFDDSQLLDKDTFTTIMDRAMEKQTQLWENASVKAASADVPEGHLESNSRDKETFLNAIETQTNILRELATNDSTQVDGSSEHTLLDKETFEQFMEKQNELLAQIIQSEGSVIDDGHATLDKETFTQAMDLQIEAIHTLSDKTSRQGGSGVDAESFDFAMNRQLKVLQELTDKVGDLAEVTENKQGEASGEEVAKVNESTDANATGDMSGLTEQLTLVAIQLESSCKLLETASSTYQVNQASLQAGIEMLNDGLGQILEKLDEQKDKSQDQSDFIENLYKTLEAFHEKASEVLIENSLKTRELLLGGTTEEDSLNNG